MKGGGRDAVGVGVSEGVGVGGLGVGVAGRTVGEAGRGVGDFGPVHPAAKTTTRHAPRRSHNSPRAT